MFKIVYSVFFKQDIEEINNFIAKDNPINAIKTIDSIFKTINMLKNFPYIGKNVDEDLREVVETNYKYKIVYRVDNDIIYIFSVYKYKNTWK